MADHPLWGAVRPDLRPSLHILTEGLLRRHLRDDHERLSQALTDLETFTDEGTALDPQHALPVEVLRQGIKARIQDSPFAAMLLEAMRIDDRDLRERGSRLVAWVMACALRRMIISPGQAAIRSGLDAARLSIKRSGSPLLKQANALGQRMNDVHLKIIQCLEIDGIDEGHQRYLERLEYLFRVTISEGAAIHRQGGNRSTGSERKSATGIERLHQNGLTSVFIPEAEKMQPEDFAGPLSLQVADMPDRDELVIGRANPDSFNPRKVAKRRLDGMIRAIARRELSLSSEFDPLTPFETSTLVETCLAHAHDPLAQVILIHLAMGGALREASRDRTQPAHHDGQNLWSFRIAVDLPDFPDLLERNEARHADDLLLDVLLPCDAVPEPEDAPSREALQAWLGEHSQPVIRKFLLSRIIRCKADWLRAHGCDPAIVGFLTGQSPAGLAQMHYTRIDRRALVAWHRRYLIHGLGLPQGSPRAIEGNFGARFEMDPELLGLIFEEQRTRIMQLGPRHGPVLSSIVEAHNQYTLHVLMLLYLATGHRPVGQPFERLGDFDLASGLLWISDKTSKGERGTRMILLPTIAREQLRHWLDHLQRLSDALRLHHPPGLQDRIAAARHDDPALQAPLLFLLDGDGPGSVELSAAQQRRALGAILPAALNWSRHVLRSSLADRVPGEVIDAWMGHAHSGQAALRPASGIGLSDLKQVSEAMDALMTDLGITALESPL